jgi:hypothetical protein
MPLLPSAAGRRHPPRRSAADRAPARRSAPLRVGAGRAALLLASVLGTALHPAAQEPPAPSADSVLSRFESSLGGAPALEQDGDVELIGRLDIAGERHRWHVFLRAQPFGYREEVTAESADPTAPGATSIYLSDGQMAFQLGAAPGGTQPLPGLEALSMLDNVFTVRLLFQPRTLLRRASLQPQESVPAGVGLADDSCAGRPAETLAVDTDYGPTWKLRFDAASGRLLGLDDLAVPAATCWRLDEWRDFDGLALPARIRHGVRGLPVVTAVVESVRRGLSLDGALFEPGPKATGSGAHGGVADVAQLAIVRIAVPLAGYIALPETRLNGAGPVTALLDTGSPGLVLEPSLAAALRLPSIGSHRTGGIFGASDSTLYWLESLQLGGVSLIQIPAIGARLAHFSELPADRPAQVILGGERVLSAGPVLDLRKGRLLMRQPPAPTLAEITGRPSFLIPFTHEGDGRLTLEVAVQAGDGAEGEAAPACRALFDTGLPHLLRLTVPGMQRLGLSTDPAEWLRRGAIRYPLAGVHAQEGADLLVRLPAVTIGPIRFERPWVLLAGLGGSTPDTIQDLDALVGTGLMLPFAMVGFDMERSRLELAIDAGQWQPTGQPGAEALAESAAASVPGSRPDDRLIVPPPGEFLGFFLDAPRAGATAEPDMLPRLRAVLEGTPAQRAGLREGDYLLAVDGIPCALAAPMQLWQRLWPDAGTSVTLSIRREGEGGTGAEQAIVVQLP